MSDTRVATGVQDISLQKKEYLVLPTLPETGPYLPSP